MEKNKIFHQNYEEDFLYVFRFTGGVPSYHWRLVFSTYIGTRKSMTSFVASFDGATFTNCQTITGTSDTILVQFKNHRLPPGVLQYRLLRWVPNDLFDDGDQKKVMPQHTGWELWSGPTDPNPPIQDIILEGMLKGDSAYEGFKKHYPDSELTEQEYVEGPIIAVAKADAVRERVERTELEIRASEEQRKQSEQLRDASESARVENEQMRQQHERLRIEAEQTRVADERSRIQTEQERISAEQIRLESESQRVRSEVARERNETTRQNVETERDTAEKKRQTDTAEAIRKVAGAIASVNTAAENADVQAGRAQDQASHPPKIVDVDGLKYWAFWDEATKDYIVSENRAEGGAIIPLFWVDPETLKFYVTYQNGYEGAKFKLENGKLYSIKTIEQ